MSCAEGGGALAGKLWTHSPFEGHCISFLLLKILSPTLYSCLLLEADHKQAESRPRAAMRTGLQTYPVPQSTLRCFHVTRDRNVSAGEPTAITAYTLQDLLTPFNCLIPISIPVLFYSRKYGITYERSPFTALLKINRLKTGRSQIPARKH